MNLTLLGTTNMYTKGSEDPLGSVGVIPYKDAGGGLDIPLLTSIPMHPGPHPSPCHYLWWWVLASVGPRVPTSA